MSHPSKMCVNLRSQAGGLRGVQRYTAEVRGRLGDRLRDIAPPRPLLGLKGHLWEQSILPAMVGGGCLWSPANTGPLMTADQVVTIHDVAPLEHPEWFSPQFAAWYRWLTPRLVKRVKQIITVSAFSKERLVRAAGASAAKIVVIPEGVDSRFHPHSALETRGMSAALGIPSAHYVLSVGTLEPRKNLRGLLAAWSSCLKRLPTEVWLIIAGAEAPANVFAGLSLGQIPQRVHFTGFVDDALLPALYSGALAFVYLSTYEGFGLPALEAMATGTTPIVACNSSLHEVVGNAGITIDPYDSDAIARAILRVIDDANLRAEYEQRGIERSKQFDWNRTALQTWDVLAEAAGA